MLLTANTSDMSLYTLSLFHNLSTLFIRCLALFHFLLPKYVVSNISWSRVNNATSFWELQEKDHRQKLLRSAYCFYLNRCTLDSPVCSLFSILIERCFKDIKDKVSKKTVTVCSICHIGCLPGCVCWWRRMSKWPWGHCQRLRERQRQRWRDWDTERTLCDTSQ